MYSQEVLHEEIKETAKKLKISPSTVSRTKKKLAYRESLLASLAQREVTVDAVADNLKTLMTKKKVMNIGGKRTDVDDNIAQFNATAKVCDIMGVDAPKEFDLKHSMAAMGDDELRDAINQSAGELIDGNVQNRITGTQNAGAIVTSTITNGQPAMVEQPREQTVRTTDS
jgi:DNA-binding transcriptional MocR family regulator